MLWGPYLQKLLLINKIMNSHSDGALMVGNRPILMADITVIFIKETNLVQDAVGLVSPCTMKVLADKGKDDLIGRRTWIRYFC